MLGEKPNFVQPAETGVKELGKDGQSTKQAIKENGIGEITGLFQKQRREKKWKAKHYYDTHKSAIQEQTRCYEKEHETEKNEYYRRRRKQKRRQQLRAHLEREQREQQGGIENLVVPFSPKK
jgi:hypothetical protein